jgi:YidC/Oxa1 family membrane protein insertase
MNKNTIIGILIIAAILIGFSYFNRPSKEYLEKKRIEDSALLAQQKIQDSMAKLKNIVKDTVKTVIVKDTIGTTDKIIKNDTAKPSALFDKYGFFAANAIGDSAFFTVENDLMKLQLLNKGGRISSVELKNYKTFDGKPLLLFSGDSSRFSLSFFVNNRTINTEDLFFEPLVNDQKLQNNTNIKVTGNDSVAFAMRIYADTSVNREKINKYIEFLYTVRGNDNMIGMKFNFIGVKDIIDANSANFELDWSANMYRQEKSASNEESNSTIYYKFYQDEVDYLSETKDREENLKSRVHWVAFKQQFFTSALIANGFFNSADIKTVNHKESKTYLKSMYSKISISAVPAGSGYSIPMRFYFGPTHYKTLRNYGLSLERQIPLGWSFFIIGWINRFAVIPVFNFLGSFALNYGIIILILTILLKIVLFPIAYKTYVSSAKMRILKPEIDEINKKFPAKEDAMKKQQATMALYKKAGVNPLSGCIPLLLQMPILFAMFRFFPSSIELRQQPFLWADDLSSYDSVWNLGFNIPFYGDHVSLFTLLMTITTIIYTKVNNQMMGSTQQMPGMKAMMYIMPVMFLGIFNNFSSGLSYYYFLANIFTFLQIFLIRRFINEDKLHQKIEEAKKRPVTATKSRFQQRLEEMAKQRGYKSKKK